jgi:glycosyltransferase involved in cell wall biosynthesis
LQNQGYKVRVLVLYKGVSEFYENIDIHQIKLSILSKFAIKLISLFKKNYLKTTIELKLQSPGKELKKQVKQFEPDVILLKAYQDLLAIKTLLVAKRFRIKVIMLTQTPFAHIKGSIFLFRLNMLFFNNLKLHSFITPILENYIAFREFGIKNVYYIPFIYPAINSIAAKKPENKIRIISVGKFQKRKDHLLLIKAIEELHLKYKLCLDIYGEIADESYYQSVKSYIQQNNLEKFIKLYGHYSYPEINQLYRKYHLFVLPAYEEPAAYTPVEAMANGLPVIVSDQCGTKYYIEEGTNGFIFKARNQDDLRKKLEIYLADHGKLTENALGALHTARVHHNIEMFGARIAEIVNKSI